MKPHPFFSDKFRRTFSRRPQPVLLAFRAREVVRLLREEARLSNYEIAVDFCLKDEKGLYQFIKRQTDYAPTAIKDLPGPVYRELLERLTKKIIE